MNLGGKLGMLHWDKSISLDFESDLDLDPESIFPISSIQWWDTLDIKPASITRTLYKRTCNAGRS